VQVSGRMAGPTRDAWYCLCTAVSSDSEEAMGGMDSERERERSDRYGGEGREGGREGERERELQAAWPAFIFFGGGHERKKKEGMGEESSYRFPSTT
jgi:hypothetical protein